MKETEDAGKDWKGKSLAVHLQKFSRTFSWAPTPYGKASSDITTQLVASFLKVQHHCLMPSPSPVANHHWWNLVKCPVKITSHSVCSAQMDLIHQEVDKAPGFCLDRPSCSVHCRGAFSMARTQLENGCNPIWCFSYFLIRQSRGAPITTLKTHGPMVSFPFTFDYGVKRLCIYRPVRLPFASTHC